VADNVRNIITLDYFLVKVADNVRNIINLD